MLPYMITRLSAFYDTRSNYFVNVTIGGFGITINESNGTTKYITAGLLNSKLLDWYMRIVSTNFHGGYFAANKQYLYSFPSAQSIFLTQMTRPTTTSWWSWSRGCSHCMRS